METKGVIISTIKYLILIFLLQHFDFPFNNKNDIIGMLLWYLILVLQKLQLEEFNKLLLSGYLVMNTFKKLPITTENNTNNNSIVLSLCYNSKTLIDVSKLREFILKHTF